MIRTMLPILFLFFFSATFFSNLAIAVNTEQYSRTFLHVGILMCREKCLRSGGCQSFNFDSRTLMCKLLEHAEGQNVIIPLQTARQLCSESEATVLSTIFVDTAHRRICVYEGTKKKPSKLSHPRQQKKKEIRTPRLLVASRHYNFTYYGLSKNLMVVIQSENGKSFDVSLIPNVNYLRSRNGSKHHLSGTATGYCIDKRDMYCLYILFHEMDDNGVMPTSNHILIYLPEVNVEVLGRDSNIFLKSENLTCTGYGWNRRSYSTGLTIDADLNLYTLRQKALYKFQKLLLKGYEDCVSVRPIGKGNQMKTMQIDKQGVQLSLLSASGVWVYDIAEAKGKGQLRSSYRFSLKRIYCLNGHLEGIVTVSKKDLTNVTFCDIQNSRSGSKCG